MFNTIITFAKKAVSIFTKKYYVYKEDTEGTVFANNHRYAFAYAMTAACLEEANEKETARAMHAEDYRATMVANYRMH